MYNELYSLFNNNDNNINSTTATDNDYLVLNDIHKQSNNNHIITQHILDENIDKALLDELNRTFNSQVEDDILGNDDESKVKCVLKESCKTDHW